MSYKKEVEGIYIFDFTGQHSVDYPSKKSRKYLAACKVAFKSDNQWSKEGIFLDSYSQVQLCRNGGCQRKPCHQDSPIDNLDTSCHSFLSAFLSIFFIPRRPVFIFYADISPKQRIWLAALWFPLMWRAHFLRAGPCHSQEITMAYPVATLQHIWLCVCC